MNHTASKGYLTHKEMSFKKEGFTPATLEFTTSRVTLNLLVLFNPADTWPVGMLKVSFVSGNSEYLHCHMLHLSFGCGKYTIAQESSCCELGRFTSSTLLICLLS